MGTLGCINDMLRRDKENRELRKRGRERSERKSWKKKNVIKIRLSR